MAKKTKKEAADRITKADTLEVQVVDIFKADNDSKKRYQQSDFNRIVDAYIKDQRDVILIAVKIR